MVNGHITVHGDCPDFRGAGLSRGAQGDRHIFRPKTGRKMSQSPAREQLRGHRGWPHSRRPQDAPAGPLRWQGAINQQAGSPELHPGPMVPRLARRGKCLPGRGHLGVLAAFGGTALRAASSWAGGPRPGGPEKCSRYKPPIACRPSAGILKRQRALRRCYRCPGQRSRRT